MARPALSAAFSHGPAIHRDAGSGLPPPASGRGCTVTAANLTQSRPRHPSSVWDLPKLSVSVDSFRKPTVKALKLRPHYAKILAFVYRNRFAIADQIRRRFSDYWRSDRTARRHLAELESLGLLGVQAVTGVSPLIPSSLRRFAQQGRNVCGRCLPRPSPLFEKAIGRVESLVACRLVTRTVHNRFLSKPARSGRLGSSAAHPTHLGRCDRNS